MIEIIKPVRYGILISLLGLVFGIGWAFWLVLGHERIHKSLEERAAKGQNSHGLIQLLESNTAQAHENKTSKTEQNEHSHRQSSKEADAHQHTVEDKALSKEGRMMHMEEEGHHDMAEGGHQHTAGEEAKPHFEGGHDSPIMELSHTRLRRGHVHAMGLGLVTIAISIVLAFTTAPDRVKIIAPILTGLGGLIYPFAWIVMGYRTPLFGPDAAEASVTVIAAPGIALVLLGISTAGLFLLKDIFVKKDA
ncbi:MAG: hypothetical protein HY026_08755 [Deltaproteobacteria bacterium]|nr:hypothetical protein [Deltaproteobacteria bacterium]